MGVFECIREEEEEGMDSMSRMIRLASYALQCTKSLYLGIKGDLVKRFLEPPPEYLCKVCGNLMVYPMIDRTGESVDEKCNNQSVDDNVPNHMLRELIFEYSKSFLGDIGEFASCRKFEMTPTIVLECPLSNKLIDRPVVVSSGDTFEELSINNWFKAGNTHCPGSDLELSQDLMFPNNAVRSIIKKWKLTDSGEGEGEDYSLPDADQKEMIRTLIKDYLKLWNKSYTFHVLEEIRSRPTELMFRELFLITFHLPACKEYFTEDHQAFELLDSPSFWEVYKQSPSICREAVEILSGVCLDFPKEMLNNHPTFKNFFIKALELSEVEDTRTRAIDMLEFLALEADPRLGSDEIASNRAILCLFQAIIKDEDVLRRESYMSVLMMAFRGNSRTMDHECLGELAIGNKLDTALGILTGISRNRDDVNAPLAFELIYEMWDAEEWVKLLHRLEMMEKWRN
ncbi:hypothetical protein OROMI_023743 [Orobanche minor]